MEASDLAITAGGLWILAIALSEHLSKTLPKFGDLGDVRRLAVVRRAFPKPWALSDEMERAPSFADRTLNGNKTVSPSEWEAHIGRLFQRRIMERHFEEDAFDRNDARHRNQTVGKTA